jgi:PE family
MSFVSAVPEYVAAAAGDLAGIGSTLAEANAAAALPTTGVVAAAADEISTGIAAMFGTYAQQYQALSAQAASFQNEFVSLLNGGAAAYVGTEIANAEQTLVSAIAGPMASGASFAAATDPLLGGLVPGVTTPALPFALPNLALASPIPGVTLPDLPVPTPPLPGLPALPPLPIPSLPGLPGGPDLTPLLNGLNAAAGQVGQTLSGLGAFLQNLLFPAPAAGVSPYPNPYQVLGETTVINLNDFGSHYRPFPILNQIAVNQGHYAQIFGSGVATDLQGFPGNVPANIQLAFQGASTFNPAAMGQIFLAGSNGYAYTVGSSLSGLGGAIQSTFNGPVVQGDLTNMNQAIADAHYTAAVQYGAHAVIDTFITGFDTSHLAITPNITVNVPNVDVAVTIAGPIGVLGPAAALLPVLTATGQQAQGFASLFPAGSIPGRMAQDFANGFSAMTDAGISANFAETLGINLLNPLGTTATLAGTATFGLPLQLGFSLLGPPFAMLGGVATGAEAFSTAAVAGNPLGMLNALGDMPAYMLNGLLNGQVLIDLPLPVSVNLAPGLLPPVTLTAIAHVPLNGLLVPPQPVTASVAGLTLPILGIPVSIPPVTTTLGGTEFSGLLPFLFNTMPQDVALAMSYQNSGP